MQLEGDSESHLLLSIRLSFSAQGQVNPPPVHLSVATSAHSAAAAKLLQSCLTLCDPIDGSPPGSPVPGFSRQEHWSGLPFPSPMHESEKGK